MPARATVTRLQALHKADLMEKIGPLIDELTTSREIVPSDLTQDYGSVVFPDPLSVTEVRMRTECCTYGMIRLPLTCV